MEPKLQNMKAKTDDDIVFALDIGTRSVIGVAGTVEDGKFKVIAIDREEHAERAMIDGQIEDIEKVGGIVKKVKENIENRLDTKFEKVSVAAAGRALKTQNATYEIEFDEAVKIDDDITGRLEAGAISNAEGMFSEDTQEEKTRNFYLVGYTASQYYLDDYEISTLKGHHAKKIKVDIIATFLPEEVVKSLYETMNIAGLEIASMTLEPIAAINCVIPESIRLLNLALVDIGAGTSDIAVCRAGSVTGYTMSTTAGDEITEKIMQEYLVDFDTAEKIKFQLFEKEKIVFNNVLGIEESRDAEEVRKVIESAGDSLCQELAEKIKEVNGGVPSAVFLAGGGSRLDGIRERMAEILDMDIKRVAVAGDNFRNTVFSEEYDIDNPEYATPLGIAVSTAMNLINDSFRVTLNGRPAKLFRSGSLNARDVLMMNGYRYSDFISKSGRNIQITIDGKRKMLYGGAATPAVLKINGENASLSTVVKAGDKIDFSPSSDGEKPEKRIGDLIEFRQNRLVFINGNQAIEDELVHDKDTINIVDEEAPVVTEAQPTVTQQPEPEEAPPVVTEAQPTVTQQPEPEEAPPVVTEAQPTVTRQPESEEAPPVVTEAQPTITQQPESEEAPPTAAGNFNIVLNGEPFAIPEKSIGENCYMFELINYSGIDFENPSGTVHMKINGMTGSFQDVIRDGDNIEIYCKPREYI